jgi:AcrR family transcriptional regulator
MTNDNIKAKSRKDLAEERKLQILDTALTVFAEKGFANTTIKDIARAAGMSDGLLYHYFTSKEKLLETAVERHSYLPQLRAILKDAKGKQYHEVLKDISLQFANLVETEKEIFNIFIQEGHLNSKVQKVWSNLANNGISILQEYILKHIAAGELRPHNAEVTARCLFSSVVMFHFTGDLFSESKVTKAQFIDSMVDNVIYGIQNTQK